MKGNSVPAEYLNLNVVVFTLLWMVIGLVAYWARGSKRPAGTAWFVVYLLAGAVMLALVAWDYIKAGESARLELDRRRRVGKNAPAAAAGATAGTRSAKGTRRVKGQQGKVSGRR